MQAELRQQPIAGFGSAGESAGEDLRVRNEHGFAAGHGIARELQKDIEMIVFKLRFERPRLAAGISGAQAVDDPHSFHAVVIVRRAENLADSTVARAPRREPDGRKRDAGFV